MKKEALKLLRLSLLNFLVLLHIGLLIHKFYIFINMRIYFNYFNRSQINIFIYSLTSNSVSTPSKINQNNHVDICINYSTKCAFWKKIFININIILYKHYINNLSNLYFIKSRLLWIFCNRVNCWVIVKL